MAKRAAPTVLFNESCLICSAEIGHYKKISAEQTLDLDFCAITDADLSEWGLTSTQALQRLYLRKDDKVFSGVDAFLAIWDCLPGFRILAKIIALPIIYGVQFLSTIAFWRLYIINGTKDAGDYF